MDNEKEPKLPACITVRLIPWVTSWLLPPEKIMRLCQGKEPRLPGGQEQIALAVFRVVNNERRMIRPYVWGDIETSLKKKDTGDDIALTLAVPIDIYVDTDELVAMLAQLFALDDAPLVDNGAKPKRLTAADWKARLADPDGLRRDDLDLLGVDRLLPVGAPENLRQYVVRLIRPQPLITYSQARNRLSERFATVTDVEIGMWLTNGKLDGYEDKFACSRLSNHLPDDDPETLL